MEQVIRYALPIVAVGMFGIQQWIKKRTGDFPEAETKIEKGYLRGQSVFLIISALLLMFRYDGTQLFATWKMIVILGLLLVLAYMDYKVQLIPNEYIAAGLLLRIAIFLLEAVADFENAIVTIMFELIACMIMLILWLILRFISRKGVGMGDIKLLALLPLFLGIVGCFEATLYAMVLFFIQACYCILTRKKGKKDVLPFAPAILGGVMIWMVCLCL